MELCPMGQRGAEEADRGIQPECFQEYQAEEKEKEKKKVEVNIEWKGVQEQVDDVRVVGVRV